MAAGRWRVAIGDFSTKLRSMPERMSMGQHNIPSAGVGSSGGERGGGEDNAVDEGQCDKRRERGRGWRAAGQTEWRRSGAEGDTTS